MDRSEILFHVKEYWNTYRPQKKFVARETYIPPTSPDIQDRDIASVVDAVLRGWFTEWWACKYFMKELISLTFQEYGVLVNSGSSASLVAMTACKYLYGDAKKLVITTALAFPTTISPIYQNGYIPIYVDVNRKTLEPDYDEIVEAVRRYGDDIVGAIFTHTLGYPFDEQRVREIIGDNRFLVVDACDALGALNPDGEPVGSYADFSTYSFFPAHHITTGEGGAVLTSNEFFGDLITKIVNWGRSCYCKPGQSNVCGQRFCWPTEKLPEGWDHKYIFDILGYNLKMTEMQAALGMSQILRIKDYVYARQTNSYSFSSAISKSNKLFTLDDVPFGASPFGFPILVREGVSISKVIDDFENEYKIGTRRLFAGNITRQPAFQNLPYVLLGDLGDTDYLANNLFWISCSPTLTEQQKYYICATLTDY